MTRARFDRYVLRAALVVALGYLAVALAPCANAHTPKVKAPYILREAPCPHDFGFPTTGCAYSATRTSPILLYVSNLDDHWTLSHELGHAYEYAHVTDATRTAWRAAFGTWDGERFADAYALCRLHWGRNASGYGYNPTKAQHRLACRLIWTNDRLRNG